MIKLSDRRSSLIGTRNGLVRFPGALCCLVLVMWTAPLHAAPSTNAVVEVLDGDTIKIRSTKSGKEASHCIRGAAAPHLDQPFGEKARDRLKDLVAGKQITHSGPVPRPYKKCSAVRFRTEKEWLAITLVSEGLAWVVESELQDKHANPGSSKTLVAEAGALLRAQEEARKARRGLWADQNPVAPWEWRAGKRTGEKTTGNDHRTRSWLANGR